MSMSNALLMSQAQAHATTNPGLFLNSHTQPDPNTNAFAGLDLTNPYVRMALGF